MDEEKQQFGRSRTNNHIDINVGHGLKQLRESIGYTLEDVEKLTGYSAEKLHKIETGSKRINIHTFLRMAATYNAVVVLDGPNCRVPLDEYPVMPFPDEAEPDGQNNHTDTPPVKKT